MKRNNLVTAVLAGIAGVAGIAGSAQAINVNPDGLGQVLIYPYYTTNNGNTTILSVVNTTEWAKAVKVRFLESLNSREVLDFNLYMSAYDVWTAAVIDNAGTPTMVTADSTCTVPYFWGNGGGFGVQPFLDFAYTGTNSDGGPVSITRAAEGHFEMLEMGTLTGGSAAAATHVQLAGHVPNTQEPASCQTLVNAWTPNSVNPYWLIDRGTDITAPSGGLFGGAALIDVGEGTMYSYNARALNAFWGEGADYVPDATRHSNPGSELPSLREGGNKTANIFTDTGVGVSLTYVNSVEAVSALFMHNNVMNEYSTEHSLAGRSEWVLTFPTKRFYVDPAFSISTPPVPPFTEAMAAALACEDVTLRFWDREEGEPKPGEGEVIVSPKPPPGEDPIFELCAETNVIRFEEADYTPALLQIAGIDNGFGSLVTLELPAGYTNGWARIDMVTNVDGAGNPQPDRMDANGLLGLPVTGFWLEAFSNSGVGAGAFYGALYDHRATRAQYIIN